MQPYQPNNDLLADRVILVTGAGRGIGRTAAKTFAQYGATVIIAGKTQGHLESLYDDIMEQGWPEPVILPLNLETLTQEQADEYNQAILDQFGRLDGLLNNAGVLGPKYDLNQYPDFAFKQVMNTNVVGTFTLTKALIPALNQSKDGRLLFTSSSVGRKGRAFWGAYAISKFATEGMMQTWADELENISSIRINAINPGGTRTDMRQSAYPAENPQSVKSPESLMPLYLYLMGPESQGIHGQSLDHDFDIPQSAK